MLSPNAQGKENSCLPTLETVQNMVMMRSLAKTGDTEAAIEHCQTRDTHPGVRNVQIKCATAAWELGEVTTEGRKWGFCTHSDCLVVCGNANDPEWDGGGAVACDYMGIHL